MSKILRRRRKDFTFSRLPTASNELSTNNDFWRKECERMHDQLQQQIDDSFNTLAEKVLELEDRIVALEP